MSDRDRPADPAAGEGRPAAEERFEPPGPPAPGGESTPARPRPSIPVLLLIAGAILAVDLWTKRWATETLAGRPPVPLIGELVRFTYTRNPGVAFGIGTGFPFPYYLFSIAATLLILYLFFRQRVPSTIRRVALALILGGALGNLVDRVTAGEVVDFIEIGWGRWHWPVFNVADSAVTVGVVLFALAWPRRDDVREAGAGAGEATTPPGPPASTPGIHERDAGAGSLRSSAQHGGAAGPLPGRGADRPVA